MRTILLTATAATLALNGVTGFISPIDVPNRAIQVNAPARVGRGAVPRKETCRHRSARHPTPSVRVAALSKAAPAAASSSVSDNVSIAGKIFPFFSMFAITPEKVRAVASTLTDNKVDFGEFVIMAAVGWGLVPAIRYFRDRRRGILNEEGDYGRVELEKPFEETRTHAIATLAGQASKIGCAVYAVDCLVLALNAIGFRNPQLRLASGTFARGAYTVWVALKLSSLKRKLLEKYAFKRTKLRDGKIQAWDRIFNALIAVVTGTLVMDFANLTFGPSITSLLSFGGIGTLVFTFASKDLAMQLESGLSVTTSDRFYEGEDIQLGDGTRGVVQRIGWTHTDIRNPDDTITSIPNSQIFNQRVTNFSRAYKCQVKQTLQFSYEDIDKMNDVCDAIEKGITEACGKDIIPGRPCRAFWREYNSDHLEVVVDSHFNIPPVGGRYLNIKQQVLNAIGNAVRSCGVEFSLPTRVEVQKRKDLETSRV